jgi:cytoskeletal protein CcmA (bactofilin family)
MSMIFGRRETVAIERTTREARPVTPALREEGSTNPERRIQHSILSADLRVSGDVISKGDITIEGAVDGNIECRCLTLAGEPEVKGSATAETVLLSGAFTGDIRARKVILTRTAKLDGDIFSDNLEIQPGASFQGEVHRLKGDDRRGATTGQPPKDKPKAEADPSPGAPTTAQSAA